MMHATHDRAFRLLTDVTRRASAQSDAQLLQRFARDRDEAAFETLLRRHSGLVWGVCRRALGHEHDTEDVFQATFLLLARDATQIKKPESLANWLHGTAYRMAQRVKRDLARRHTREHRAARPGSVEGSSTALAELQAVLDEEVGRLPEKYRAAFTLCVLDGKSREEAAARLGCAPGTVTVHLCRARERLQRQLARRGVTLSGALTAAALGETPSTAVPGAVLRATLHAAQAGSLPTRVAALLQGAGTLGTKQKVLGVLVAVAGLAAVCAGAYAMLPQPPAKGEPPAAPPAKAAFVAGPAAEPQREQEKAIEVSGRVLTPDGKPAAGAKLVFPTFKSPDQHELTAVATADAEGRFRGTVPAAKSGQMDDRTLVAHAPGFGPAWIDLAGVRPGQELTVKLVKAEVPVKGRVLTLEGKPVAGATIQVSHVAAPNMGDLGAVFKAWSNDPDRALGAARDRLYYPAAGGLPRKLTTDAEGRFEIQGVGDGRLLALSVQADTIEHTTIRVATVADFDPKTVAPTGRPRPGYPPSVGPPLYGATFDHVARPTQVVTGVVRDKKTGKPLSNVGVSGHLRGGWWENGVYAKTDAEGYYKLVGLPKAPGCTVTFFHANEDTAYLGLTKTVPEAEGLTPIAVDIDMVRGVVITGCVTDKDTGKPVPGGVRYVPLTGNKEVGKLPGTDVHSDGAMSYHIDNEGRFRIVAPPGLGIVMVQAEHRVVAAKPYTQARFSPDDLKKPYFKDLEGLGETFISAAAHYEPMSGKNAFRVIDPAEGSEPLMIDFALDPGKTVKGRISDADSKPLAGATVAGLGSVWEGPTRLEGAVFTAVAVDEKYPRTVAAVHADRKLSRAIQLRGDEKEEPVIRLQPWGTLTGTVQDKDGKPLAGVTVQVSFRDHTVSQAATAARFGRDRVTTDRDGKFRADIPFGGQEFRITLHQGAKYLDAGGDVKKLTVPAGETKDLGTIAVKTEEP